MPEADPRTAGRSISVMLEARDLHGLGFASEPHRLRAEPFGRVGLPAVEPGGHVVAPLALDAVELRLLGVYDCRREEWVSVSSANGPQTALYSQAV